MGTFAAAQRRRERATAQPEESNLAQAIESARPGGLALDGGARQFLEPRFGHNFADVRIHSDAAADRLATDFDAVAFTTDSDIFFRQGAYAPDTPAGRHLLAHELTHTIQQAAGPVAGTPGLDGVAVSTPSDAFEQAAERNAASIMRGGPGEAAATLNRQATVQRAVALDEIEVGSPGDNSTNDETDLGGVAASVGDAAGGAMDDAAALLGAGVAEVGAGVGSAVAVAGSAGAGTLASAGALVGGGIAGLGSMVGGGMAALGISGAGGAVEGAAEAAGADVAGLAADAGAGVSAGASAVGGDIGAAAGAVGGAIAGSDQPAQTAAGGAKSNGAVQAGPAAGAGDQPAPASSVPAGEVVVVHGIQYLIYSDEVRTYGTGGTISWAGRNPGNIRTGDKYGAFPGKHVHDKKVGNFAIFPDESTGMTAIAAVLKGYGHVTVSQAMHKYAPSSDGNDPDAYARTVAKHMGVTVTAYVDTLDDSQLQTFAEAIKTVEGWKAGKSYALDDPKLPLEVRALLGGASATP